MEQDEYHTITRQLVQIMTHQQAVNTRLDASIDLLAKLATKYDIQLSGQAERAESHAERLAKMEAIIERLDATIARLDQLIDNRNGHNGRDTT